MSTPKTIAAATKLLERYADLDGRIALVEADRTVAIAQANQRADVAAAPMLQERDHIAIVLEPWWDKAGADLAGGNKSVQLGGCKVGTRDSRPKLAHQFDTDDKAVEALRGSRFAKMAVKVRYSLDRAATLKLLQIGGKTSAAIKALGFREESGQDQFFVQRVEQPGTITSGS